MFWNIFRRERSLLEVLHEVKSVTYKGIKFRLKKLNAMDFMDGSKILFKHFETYKYEQMSSANEEASHKKVREHYIDTLMSGIVSPELSRKEEQGKVFVEDLFKDWDLVIFLYTEIISFTYGKKKLSQENYLAKT